ncbi:MAG: hypothetical protein V4606_03250 [Patescibacteria group bacterium]
MPNLRSLLMILLVTVIGAGATLYLKNEIHALHTINGETMVTIPSMSTPIATTSPDTETPTVPTPAQEIPEAITGTLSAVDTGCFSDGVCFATVAGQKVILLIGRYQGPVGRIIGAESIGDLETHIGKTVTVYAGKDTDGNFTLLGNEAFYLKVASETTTTTGACKVGGCSAQLCGEASDMDGMVTTCEFRAEYACYRTATCERQTTGKCGWTQTTELAQCLKNPPTQL